MSLIERVHLDLDGVLVDFVGGFQRALGLKPPDPWPAACYDSFAAHGLKETSELWNTFDTEDFWANLDWMPDGLNILRILESKFRKENIAICTSPTRNPGCAAGKVRWIQKHLPEYSRRFFIGTSKHLAGGEGGLLIDDSDHNVKKYRAYKGQAILVPRVWNSRWTEKRSAPVVIAEELCLTLPLNYFLTDKLGELSSSH